MPTPPTTETPPRHTAGPDQTRAELRVHRPDLLAAFEAALPTARAAILARVLHALRHEPLPGVIRRSPTVELADGRILTVPDEATQPFANPAPGLTAHLTPATARDRNPHLTAADERSRNPHLTPADERSRNPHLTPTDERSRNPRPVPRDGQGRNPHLAAAADDWSRSPRPAPGPSRESGAGRDPGGAREHGAAHDDPATLLRALDLGPHTARFATEVDNSVANLALALADAPAAIEPLHATAGDPDGLGRREQAVVDGHPLHPCCRTRGGMTVADVLAYAPEHRPIIRLRRLAVPPGRWYGDTPPVLYAHPWQARRLQDRYPWLTDAGETGEVRPLMSLRTVAPLSGGDHLKTAVDLQLTSAVRTVSPAAVHNGPRLSALLARLTAGLPLTVLRETAAGAVLIDGTPQRHLAYLRRQAPRIGPAETVLPLGALAPLLPGIATDPYAWWHDLAHLLFPPLLTVLDRGVALEAHGQNTLLVLDGTRPARIVYRDLGGVRVSARRLRAAGVEAPPVEGDLPTDDPDVLRTKLAAAVLGTVAAQLIAVLAGAGADPGRLWATTAAAIRGTGTADAARLLTDPLPVKATSAMRLADDPLADIWTHLDNPMAGA